MYVNSGHFATTHVETLTQETSAIVQIGNGNCNNKINSVFQTVSYVETKFMAGSRSIGDVQTNRREISEAELNSNPYLTFLSSVVQETMANGESALTQPYVSDEHANDIEEFADILATIQLLSNPYSDAAAFGLGLGNYLRGRGWRIDFSNGESQSKSQKITEPLYQQFQRTREEMLEEDGKSYLSTGQ